MPPLPEMIITLLVPFAPLFTRPVWGHAQILLIGALLCRGPCTVAAVMRVMGLGGEKRFEKYHRVLSREPREFPEAVCRFVKRSARSPRRTGSSMYTACA